MEFYVLDCKNINVYINVLYILRQIFRKDKRFFEFTMQDSET